MNKKKVPLNSLIQSKVAVPAFYSGYHREVVWVPPLAWLRVGAIDVPPVRGHRDYVCVDFYVDGLWNTPQVYLPDLGDYVLDMANTYREEWRAAVHYDEIEKVWCDGCQFLTMIPHYTSEHAANHFYSEKIAAALPIMTMSELRMHKQGRTLWRNG